MGVSFGGGGYPDAFWLFLCGSFSGLSFGLPGCGRRPPGLAPASPLAVSGVLAHALAAFLIGV